MSAPLNPAQIEENIRTCAERIHEGVKIVTARERVFRKARREYEHMYHRAYLDAPGPAHTKKSQAEIVTKDMRERAEEAEVEFRYAERAAKAVENELRAWQSVGASIRAMFAVETGVGR